MTEFLLIQTKLQREKFIKKDTSISASAKNFGVVFDNNLNFRKHISQTCRACFYHIRDLRRNRKSLSLVVLTKAPRFSRSVSILKRLHWLPVKFRIHLKICPITFRALKDTSLHIWLTYFFSRNAQNI